MRTFHNVINEGKNEHMLLYQSLAKYYVWRNIYQHEKYPVYLRPDHILEVNCGLSMNLIPGIELTG